MANATRGKAVEHEQAAQVLPDYAEGALDPADADALERHVASCVECNENLSLLRRIGMEIAESGAAVFDDHPESARLVDYALVPPQLAEADLARIDAHVKSCPTCSREVASVRSAESSSTSWARSVEEALRVAAFPATRIPAFATAVIALFLAYPAYLGVVQLPRVAQERQEAVETLARLATKPPPLQHEAPAWMGGPSATLALAGTTRSVGDDAHAADAPPIPVVQLRDHQAFLPVRIDFDVSALGAEPLIVVTLREINSPQQLWRHSGSAAEFWDPNDEAINLLLPADALHPGTYTLEIAKEGSPAAAYSADFAIED